MILVYGEAKDYSIVDYSKIKEYIKPLLLTYTQKEAGFNSNIQEKILRVPIKESTIKLANRLKKDLVVEGKSGFNFLLSR
mgnify:CR=1 FL=1